MTMNKIMAKLHKNKKGQYKLLGLCIFLSILLVTSYSIMYFSPTVQNLLPPGGDTRKLSMLMLGVTIIGCTIFTVYGCNLFYKYKSREFGIFLALGQTKKQLTKCLVKELIMVIGIFTGMGLICSIPASYLIWKLFQAILINSDNLNYQFRFTGLILGILFACFLIICILIEGIHFIRQTDIIKIINSTRKTEIVHEIKPWTGKVGIFLIIIGIFLAMGIPAITARVFSFLMPSIWNITYLISIIGLYLFMLHAVAQIKKGKHPEKYYKNIISTNLMRFTARQTTKNMCVITLLLFVLLLSSFWGMMYYNSAFSMGDRAPIDYSMHYPLEEEPVTKDGIYNLAQKHNVAITFYKEAIALELLITYINRDLNDDGKYITITDEKFASFLSESDLSSITGKKLTIQKGEYLTIVPYDYQPSIWIEPDCLETISTSNSQEKMSPKWIGTIEFDNLTNISDPFVFVLSDEDYQNYLSLLTSADMEQMIFFNVNDVYHTYDFANELKNDFISHSSESMSYSYLYDSHQESLALKSGKEYSYGEHMELNPDNPDLMGYWKYAPFFKVLMKTDSMQLVAVFVLLSVYIAIISLTAAGIMSYIRSITVAMDNKQLFGDLQKLGANKNYVKRVICMQLKKIFAYPTIAGSGIVSIFAAFLIYFNDMRIQQNEINMFIMILALIGLIAVYMYIIYCVSFKKMKKIVEI